MDNLDEETKKNQEGETYASNDDHQQQAAGDDSNVIPSDEYEEYEESSKPRKVNPQDPEVQAAIHELLYGGNTIAVRHEKLLSTSAVTYTEVMNTYRNRNNMKMMYKAAKIANARSYF